MMDLRSIFIANGVGIFIMLLLTYASMARIRRGKIEDKVYLIMILGVIAGCFMEAFSYGLDGNLFPGARILNYIANTYLFTANLLLPFCILVYIDLNLFGDPGRLWTRYRPQIIVGVFMLVMNVVNFFIPITYTITDQNVYERGPFSYFYYIVILYYCISAALLTRRYEKENGAKAFFNVNMFLLPILIGAALQFMFYGLSLAWLAASVGLTGLYMMQQNETSYVDPLLEMYNRRYMDYIISSWIGHGSSFCGMMIDVDYFKSINDRYGHSEGDHALITLSAILRKARRDGELIFRFAGDEFIILKRTPQPDGLAGYRNNLRMALEEHNADPDILYPLRVSYGESFFDPGADDLDTFMKALDAGMYEMKAENHKRERA